MLTNGRLISATVVLGALTACTDAPPCTYWFNGIIGKSQDESVMPMLPYNPYWVSSDPSLPIVGSPDDRCAGQPGHPGRLHR
jgi:hypothetical protein